jgi:uncharacterized protein (TIGR03437 family)
LISPLLAAPKLRLSPSATVGPLSLAAGSNGPAQTVEAYNTGDGTLALTTRVSAAWLTATVGASRNCTTRSGVCLPVQIALQTSALAKGIYTGIVTLSDPNAVDAPQTITVTVQMGGGVPDRLDFIVAPNGSVAEAAFTTNNQLTVQSNAPWLAVSLEGSGTFRFSYPYKVRVTAPPGVTENTVNSSFVVSRSAFAPDNKTVNVGLRISSQPIVKTPDRVAVTMVQGAAKRTLSLTLANAGLGTLTVSGGSDPSATGGNWLTTGPAVSGVTPATIDIGTLATGTYDGKLLIASNAVNSPTTIFIDLEVVAPSAPITRFQGVLDNATFETGAPLGAGTIAAIFGEQFIAGDPVVATKLPLETQLGGARVLINNRPAFLYYASPIQINFQVPYDTGSGPAEIRVERDGQRGNAVSADISVRAPRILRFIGDYGIIVNQDGTFPMPPTAGIPSRPARAGDALTVYAIGLGPTSPVVESGVASPGDPLAYASPVPSVTFGGGLSGAASTVTPLFAGLTPGLVGLFQINVVVPDDAPKGASVPFYLLQGATPSNRVAISIE